MPESSILLVDDEKDIRDIAGLLLESAGYKVCCAADGRAALLALDEQPFDLVITDMLMPEMDGVELMAAIRRQNPDQRIIAMSGGGRAPKESYLKIGHLCGAHELLSKPFNREQLLRVVESCGVKPGGAAVL
ncbi:MAG: response regulator [Opitutales bacterium]